VLRRTLAFIALTLGLLALPAVASARPLTFGVHTPDDPFGGSTLKVDALERDTGRHIGIVSWFQSWGGQPWVARVQPHVFNAVINSGRAPLVAWEPWAPDGGAEQPQYSLARIAGGAFDDYIAEFGRGLRDIGATVYVRPMHEMNGNWYPWSGSVNGNSPALFVRAWRHMVDIVRGQGATNVRWVFTPLNEDWPITSSNRLERYYPGPQYVDVLAVDGYNWGATKPFFGGWRSFSRTFNRAYARLTKLGPQPIWIAEVGSATEGGSKAAWVRDMFKRARSMNRLSAIVWMDTIDAREGDWRMRSPADVLAAFGPDDDSAAAAASLRPNARVRRGRRGDAAGQSGRAAWALRISAPVHLGRRAVVRWNETAAQDGVERWRIYLNDKRVRTLRAGRSRVMRKRMNRTGRYRWKVEGVDAGGRTVVSASRGFRVVRRG
jgi:hypothetical protein